VTAITPIANILEVVRANTIGIAENYFVLIHVREENSKLNTEIGRLKLENHFLKSELQTAERAKLLVAFQERTPSRTLAARIIGNATGTNARVVFVDRGSTAGVMKGMAVVTPDGIVGKVIAAYPTASQVQLITDENFAAGVVSEKHRVHGTLKGKGQNKPMVDYVQNEETVEQGEMFYTSGDDRVFPKGMPVGVATVVRAGKSFKEIYVTPSAYQHGPEEVLIVLEGVHQAIPERTATASTDVKVLAPPPAEGGSTQTQDMRASLQTEADKLRERYKKIGEMQNHKFGEGLPGSKPPDFTVDPDKARQQAAQRVPPAPGAQPPAGSTAPPAQAPAVSAPKPSTTSPAATAPDPNRAAQAAAPKPVPSAKPTQPVQAETQPAKPQAAKTKPTQVKSRQVENGPPVPLPIP
jgi:rod shape-determining protein MreC